MRTLATALFSLVVLAGLLDSPGPRTQAMAQARHTTDSALTRGDGKDGGDTGGDDDEDDDDEEVRTMG
ncbi:hypothetical protein [Archangium sp.]|jgi:hypothetical protein|uniref:hypothetical protein n=1 Tax=Archangium sp. TaxID=1872627 RepID=UPI002EDAD67A